MCWLQLSPPDAQTVVSGCVKVLTSATVDPAAQALALSNIALVLHKAPSEGSMALAASPLCPETFQGIGNVLSQNPGTRPIALAGLLAMTEALKQNKDDVTWSVIRHGMKGAVASMRTGLAQDPVVASLFTNVSGPELPAAAG